MSKLSDYSKFDNLDDDDSNSSDEGVQDIATSKPVEKIDNVIQSGGITKKGSTPGRYIFEYNGHKIYEWEQSLDGENTTAPNYVLVFYYLNKSCSHCYRKLFI